MLPVIQAFSAARQLSGVTVAADTSMISEGNQKDIKAAGLLHILGMRTPCPLIPSFGGIVSIPADNIPRQDVFTQPWPVGGRLDYIF